MLGVDVKDKILGVRYVPEAEVRDFKTNVRYWESKHSELRLFSGYQFQLPYG